MSFYYKKINNNSDFKFEVLIIWTNSGVPMATSDKQSQIYSLGLGIGLALTNAVWSW